MASFIINRPTELADHLGYPSLYAGELPEEDEWTDAEAFAMAFAAFGLYIDHSATEDGKEALRQWFVPSAPAQGLPYPRFWEAP